MRDLALAFEVGRARLQAHHVRLLQLQFGRVLDGDDALAGSISCDMRVEQRRLARAGAAGDQDVEAAARGDLQHRRHLLRRCCAGVAMTSSVILFLENLRIEMRARRSPAAG